MTFLTYNSAKRHNYLAALMDLYVVFTSYSWAVCMIARGRYMSLTLTNGFCQMSIWSYGFSRDSNYNELIFTNARQGVLELPTPPLAHLQ